MTTRAIKLSFLGEPTFIIEGVDLPPFDKRKKAYTLLAYMVTEEVFHGGIQFDREHLANLFWDKNGRNNLSKHLKYLEDFEDCFEGRNANAAIAFRRPETYDN